MMKLSAPLFSTPRHPLMAAHAAGPLPGPVSVASSGWARTAWARSAPAVGSPRSGILAGASAGAVRGVRSGLLALAAGLLVLLTGCDQLGIEDPAKVAAAKEAEGKAIGGACRNAMRAIEDCYALNPKSQKAAVYEGWREMDEYMRENKLEGTRPVVARGAASKPAESSPSDTREDEDKPAKGEKAEKADKADKAEKADKGGKGKGGN